MGSALLLSDADLHSLVDGHLDPDRRADVLRRAAASPRDRALVEAWQDQNDQIRALFAGVEREPLPRALDLRTPPQLQAIPLDEAVPAAAAKPARWRRVVMGAVTMSFVTAGLAGPWYVSGLPSEGMRTSAVRASGGERMLADRTVAALAFGELDATSTAAIAEPPPTAVIPDLSGAGFTFTGAEARGVSPRTVIFRYRNAEDERVAIGTTRSAADDSEPAQREGGFTWRSRRVAYAIYGTVAPERLRAMALSLNAELHPE